jgi:hypothetical protein
LPDFDTGFLVRDALSSGIVSKCFGIGLLAAPFFPPDVCDSASPPRFAGFALVRAAIAVGLPCGSAGIPARPLGGVFVGIGLDFETGVLLEVLIFRLATMIPILPSGLCGENHSGRDR